MTPSTGAIDYFLSLDAELEGGQGDYLEQMVRMDVVNTAHFNQVCLPLPAIPPPSVFAHQYCVPKYCVLWGPCAFVRVHALIRREDFDRRIYQ